MVVRENKQGEFMNKQTLNPVGWFEIPVKDLNRGKKFYETVFSVKLEANEMGSLKMAWFPTQDGKAGATGSLVQGQGYVPSHHGAQVYFSVDDIEKTLSNIERSGGKTLSKKMAIGQYGFVASFEDCEGNRVSLHARS